MSWKIDYCENCGKKKMLKNECMNCEEIKIQQNN